MIDSCALGIWSFITNYNKVVSVNLFLNDFKTRISFVAIYVHVRNKTGARALP
jgi:hypothetical protein